MRLIFTFILLYTLASVVLLVEGLYSLSKVETRFYEELHNENI